MKTFSTLITSLILSILLFGYAHGGGKSHKTDVRKPWYDEGPVIRVGAKEDWEATCRNGAHVKLLAIGTNHPGPDPGGGRGARPRYGSVGQRGGLPLDEARHRAKAAHLRRRLRRNR